MTLSTECCLANFGQIPGDREKPHQNSVCPAAFTPTWKTDLWTIHHIKYDHLTAETTGTG